MSVFLFADFPQTKPQTSHRLNPRHPRTVMPDCPFSFSSESRLLIWNCNEWKCFASQEKVPPPSSLSHLFFLSLVLSFTRIALLDSFFSAMPSSIQFLTDTLCSQLLSLDRLLSCESSCFCFQDSFSIPIFPLSSSSC